MAADIASCVPMEGGVRLEMLLLPPEAEKILSLRVAGERRPTESTNTLLSN